MPKFFITDEINDAYSAKVNSLRMLRTDRGGNFFRCTSAHTLISAERVASGACMVRGIILGDKPATSSTVVLYDTYTCASHVSAFGMSGANIVALFGADSSGAATGAILAYSFPNVIPLDIYCASGLSVGISVSAADSQARLGGCKNVTVIVQE